MSVDRQQVIAAARMLLGTPSHHQGRLAGVGLDCACRSSWRARWAWWRRISTCRHTASGPTGTRCRRSAMPTCAGIDRAQPGDVLLIAWGQQAPAQHLGIVTPYWHGGLAFVHAEGLRWRCVIEKRLMPGRALSILQAYALPGIT